MSNFCTMAGMEMLSHHNRNMISGGEHNIIRSQWSSPKSDLPVIMADDATDTDSESDHNTHQMDHSSHSMDHTMDGMDHSSMGHDMKGMSMGTIMYMDGFHSALFSSSETPPPCLNLFNPTWTLDTEGKFVFAMLFITTLGIMVEGCGVWRVKCLRKGRSIRRAEKLKRSRGLQSQQHQQISGDTSQDQVSFSPQMPRMMWRILPRFLRDAVNKCCTPSTLDAPKLIKRYEIMAASLHAIRAWLGYLLMLAVMSYAIEFLVCTILGMVVGRYWFIENEEDGIIVVGDNSNDVDQVKNDGMWGGGDPCCGIDDDDEDFSMNDNMDAASEVETRLMQNEPLENSNINEPLLGGSLSRRNVA